MESKTLANDVPVMGFDANVRTLTADVIIVGAGTAGCILAARLSERPDLNVLLIEAGPKARNPWIHVPIGFSRLLHDRRVNWCYRTTPQTHLCGRQIDWPRGKVIGGSGAINGMVWVRGAPSDYDAWADAVGDPGWSWANATRLFAGIEAAPADADPQLGRNGAIALSRPSHRHVLAEAFVEAAANAEVPRRSELSISDASGAGDYLITARNGQRTGAASAYLTPALKRPNLSVLTGATVLGVEFDDTLAASGLKLATRDGETAIRARRATILCAGAVNTPHLLMHSGIGPGELLRRHGVAVRVDRCEVGANLQDHLGVRVIAAVDTPVTVNDDFRRPWRLAGHALRYAVRRTGPISMGGAYAGAFLGGEPGEAPLLQIHFLPLSSERRGWSFHPFSGITANVCQLRPFSRGRVWLTSSEPREPPAIDPAYLSDPRDCAVLCEGVRLTRRILAAPPLGTRFGAREKMPGNAVHDEDLAGYVARSASTVFHPVGTCRMGTDAAAVVDRTFAVRGTARLYAADASIVPTLPSGNTNAAVTFVAERAAETLGAMLA